MFLCLKEKQEVTQKKQENNESSKKGDFDWNLYVSYIYFYMCGCLGFTLAAGCNETEGPAERGRDK